MSELYQRTFRSVKMSEESADSLRASLVSHCSDCEKEVIPMNRKIARRSVAFLVAALIAILPISALACGVYYYVTYEVRENAELPDNAIDLTDPAAESLAFSDYAYQEEEGMILVKLGDEADDAVSYAVSDDASAPENAAELAEQDTAFERGNYSYDETDGKVIVHLDNTDVE